MNYVHSKGGVVFGNRICHPDLVDEMHMALRNRFDQSIPRNYWISCNMNALDSTEFKSKTRSYNTPKENDGITLDFLGEFMEHFAPHSIGMDLSDVNFEVANDSSCRHADEQTFRELFERILHSVNQEPELPLSDHHTLSYMAESLKN